jgi:phosphoribosylanthranilate isomerase
MKPCAGISRTLSACVDRDRRGQAVKELAGGLNAYNVREAIDQVQPLGVDLCSGVRSNGRLDPEKLESFFNAVRG